MNKKFPTKFLKQKWRAGNRLWLRILKLKLLITHSFTEQFWIKNCNKISITYLLNTSLCLYCRCWWTKILKRVETQKQHASKVPKHEGICTLISLQSWTGNAQSRACVDVLPRCFSKYAWLYYVAMTHDYSHENIYFIDSWVSELFASCNQLKHRKELNTQDMGNISDSVRARIRGVVRLGGIIR